MRRVELDSTTAQLAARIPRRLHYAIKQAAVREEVTLRDWILDALEAHMRRVQVTDEN